MGLVGVKTRSSKRLAFQCALALPRANQKNKENSNNAFPRVAWRRSLHAFELDFKEAKLEYVEDLFDLLIDVLFFSGHVSSDKTNKQSKHTHTHTHTQPLGLTDARGEVRRWVR